MSAFVFFSAQYMRCTQSRKPVRQLSDILHVVSTVAPMERGDIWYRLIINQDHQASSPINYFFHFWFKTFFLNILLPQHIN
jgi:hypothetical protein